MRVQELYAQVAGLGFEKTLEDDDIFYQAANRALLQVNAIRPAVGSYVINHRPMENLLPENFEPMEKKEELTFEALAAKAYYFECDGNGFCYIERRNSAGGWSVIGDIKLTGSGAFVAYSGLIREGSSFVSDSVRLRFLGEYLYFVKNVALYGQLYSESASDIPEYKPYTKYDMANLTEDFIRLADPPVVEDGTNCRLYRDYDMEGRRFLLIPRGNAGVFKVVYERRPTEIVNEGTAADDEALIDLDEELCSLLPLVIGAYVWTDDEPEKAEYYLNMFRERRSEIMAKEREMRPVKYVTNGW